MKNFIKQHPKKILALATAVVAGAIGYFVPELRNEAYAAVRAALVVLCGVF
jgi:hypothetical protein